MIGGGGGGGGTARQTNGYCTTVPSSCVELRRLPPDKKEVTFGYTLARAMLREFWSCKCAVVGSVVMLSVEGVKGWGKRRVVTYVSIQ